MNTTRELIWCCIRKKGVAIKQDMYNYCETLVSARAGDTDYSQVRVGLHQMSDLSPLLFIQFNSIQFSLFPAHINISYSNNNVYILCRKRGGQKTMLMDVRPLTITSKLRVGI